MKVRTYFFSRNSSAGVTSNHERAPFLSLRARAQRGRCGEGFWLKSMGSRASTRGASLRAGSMQPVGRAVFTMTPQVFGATSEQLLQVGAWAEQQRYNARDAVGHGTTKPLRFPPQLRSIFDAVAAQYAQKTGLTMSGVCVEHVNKFTAGGDVNRWEWHTDAFDGTRGRPTLTAVLTLLSEDAVGGAVHFSNSPDGSVAVRVQNGYSSVSSPTFPFTPTHGSVYMFPGCVAMHRPGPMKHGTRYSFVATYVTTATFDDLRLLWSGGDASFKCEHCSRLFKTAKTRGVHYKKCLGLVRGKRQASLKIKKS